jgi:hypothetical protein
VFCKKFIEWNDRDTVSVFQHVSSAEIQNEFQYDLILKVTPSLPTFQHRKKRQSYKRDDYIELICPPLNISGSEGVWKGKILNMEISKRWLCLLHTGFLLGLFFDLEDGRRKFFSKMMVNFYSTTRHHFPEDTILHSNQHKNLKSNTHYLYFIFQPILEGDKRRNRVKIEIDTKRERKSSKIKAGIHTSEDYTYPITVTK